ncbi:MAG: GNAT family N-acetyltransferase [Omnitrophica bacterium]|nr:GNAT family N-acetyltransferase [Candidatus Omnitrophota bacterium]
MIIRNESESNILDITTIHNQAFSGSDEGKIVENLRKNKNLTLSLVSEIDKKIIGAIAYESIYNKNKEIIGISLAPMAILPSHQRQKVGSKFVKKGNDLGLSKVFKKYCTSL